MIALLSSLPTRSMLAQCPSVILPSQYSDNHDASSLDLIINRVFVEHTTSIAFFNMVNGFVRHRICRYQIKLRSHIRLIREGLSQSKCNNTVTKDITEIFLGFSV